jgi:hypothetical protein
MIDCRRSGQSGDYHSSLAWFARMRLRGMPRPSFDSARAGRIMLGTVLADTPQEACGRLVD